MLNINSKLEGVVQRVCIIERGTRWCWIEGEKSYCSSSNNFGIAVCFFIEKAEVIRLQVVHQTGEAKSKEACARIAIEELVIDGRKGGESIVRIEREGVLGVRNEVVIVVGIVKVGDAVTV